MLITVLAILYFGLQLMIPSPIFADNTWTISTIDSDDEDGEYTSIAIVQEGFARISYYDSTNGDFKFAIKVAKPTTTLTPTQAPQSGSYFK